MTKFYAIGIDLGGTKIEFALVDQKGQVSSSIKIPTRVKEGRRAIESDILENIATLKKQVLNKVIGVGIGVPGQIDLDGTVIFAPNLQWENVPLKVTLAEKTELPVVITNDVRAATFGEWVHGAGKGSHDIVCLFVGTGIGSGIVSGGHLLQGYTNSAGELGHTIIQMDGALCTCGSQGCLEALASGWAIAKKAKLLIQENPHAGKMILDLAHGNIDEVTTKIIVQAYHEKDLIAEELIVEMFHALTVGCINIANAFNPERLILGGGVLTGLPEVFEHVRSGVKKYALKSASEKIQIIPALLTKDAGAIGAGTLAWNSKGNDV